jgi:hypothetical protein
MKKQRSPQEKKALAYKRDHYVSAGESRHAFRKNWPKKKAMMNQIHRHRAAQALHELERLGDAESILNSPQEVTATQLKKVDPRKKLRKWGVMSLQKFVKRNQAARVRRPESARKERERVDTAYMDQITALEQDLASPTAQKFLKDMDACVWHLNLFLKRNPEWKPRLEHQLSELRKSEAKARLKLETKNAQKRRADLLRGTSSTQTKTR